MVWVQGSSLCGLFAGHPEEEGPKGKGACNELHILGLLGRYIVVSDHFLILNALAFHFCGAF
jgi:hypothetical protein